MWMAYVTTACIVTGHFLRVERGRWAALGGLWVIITLLPHWLVLRVAGHVSFPHFSPRCSGPNLPWALSKCSPSDPHDPLFFGSRVCRPLQCLRAGRMAQPRPPNSSFCAFKSVPSDTRLWVLLFSGGGEKLWSFPRFQSQILLALWEGGPRRPAFTKRVFWESLKEECNTVTPLTCLLFPQPLLSLGWPPFVHQNSRRSLIFLA